MFGGLIEHCGTIVKHEIIQAEEQGKAHRIWIKSEFDQLVLGESIAVDGICLTVVTTQNREFCCDISPETMQVTTAAEFSVGKRVNLERALLIGSRLGGHFVLGHVDTTAKVLAKKIKGEFIEYEFGKIAETTAVYLLPKGSITINGVSLTLNTVESGNFSVMLIPHTLALTNLGDLTVGCLVNIEFDYLAKIIRQQYSLHASQFEVTT